MTPNPFRAINQQCCLFFIVILGFQLSTLVYRGVDPASMEGQHEGAVGYLAQLDANPINYYSWLYSKEMQMQ